MENKHNELSQLLNRVKLSAVVKNIHTRDDNELDQLGLDFYQFFTEIVDDSASTFDGIKANLKEELEN